MTRDPQSAGTTTSDAPARPSSEGAEVQFEMFQVERPMPAEIFERALSYDPIAKFAMFSGGDGSLTTVLWAMEHVPGCEVLHINTGIGLKRVRQFVRETCAERGWSLTEIRAREDCGMDYEALVLEHGFPGPAAHQFMYRCLKERAVELIVRRRKTQWRDKVMLITGIRHADSQRRTGYGGREINFKGAQMWVNPMYWEPMPAMAEWALRHNIARNPVAETLGMSGECLCGAFADRGEKAIVRIADPEFADHLDDLERRVRAAGHNWGWEDRPPPMPSDALTADMFAPMCVNCLKSPAREDLSA